MSEPETLDLRARVAASPGGRVAVRLAAAVDARRAVAPAVAVFDRGGAVAVDAPERIGAASMPTVDLPAHVALPPLVNAHAHLDLTNVGALPFDGTFADWAGAVRARRATTPAEVAAAVHEGAHRAAAGGTGFIGDIAGNFGMAALEALRDAAPAAGLRGVSFVEVFGIGSASGRGTEFLRGLRAQSPAERGGIRLGVSPHAPYSCDDAVYAAAAALGLPLATHLAETLDELRFVQDASGPFADLLRAVGAWTPELRGWGTGPVERVLPALRGSGAALVHLNYLHDAALEALAREAAVPGGPVAVYCPRASAYFRHPAAGHAPHRYRDMLAAGIPVALGTDSAIVLGDAPTISVLDEMRALSRRDGADPAQLVAMATVHGARALGVDPAEVRLPGAAGGAARAMVAVRMAGGANVNAAPGPAAAIAALRTALDGTASCEWLWK
jgi:cytosine/adenosine deaminase-related metal-dependent hydrolase